MSTYIRFDGKSYKLPDALILGRGEPFDISDRTLARAHARLVHKKGKWKIKDLSSDCGIMVNGNKIQPGKFHSVNPGDKVLLGNVPLEVYEAAPEHSYVEVINFTAHDINDYAPLIYSVLFILGAIIAATESSGSYTNDLIFLAAIAVFLKFASVVTRVIRTTYFPVKIVTEANLTYEGATFHITGNENFSIKFSDVDKWYMVGKCFFINIYDKDMIFLLNEGLDELESLLRERCPKKKSVAEPILEKIALVPVIFIILSWLVLPYSDTRFFHFFGHGVGVLGLVGLLGFFFSEHLRELLPIPRNISHRATALGLASVIAITMVMQFSQLQTHYKVNKLKKQLTSCFNDKSCNKSDFSLLISKSLSDDDDRLMKRICSDGNNTACPNYNERKPASK
ncbi:MAG: FHA domain-containing protein [Bdellovibrionota bacterium]